jgi:hypothetical protein
MNIDYKNTLLLNIRRLEGLDASCLMFHECFQRWSKVAFIKFSYSERLRIN